MTLTRNAIMGLPPGAKLDALVAERVMGWTSYKSDVGRLFGVEVMTFWSPPGKFRAGAVLPPYSTDIAAAWRVVEKLTGSQPPPRFTLAYAEGRRAWTCNFGNGWVDAPTAPLAIVRAALLAVTSR